MNHKLLIGLFLSVGIGNLFCQIGTYVEDKGLLVFEAESSPVVGGWKLEKSVEEYSGTGYINYPGPVGTITTLPKGTDPINYKFKIVKPGLYWLRLRMYHCASRGDLDNDTWIQVDNLGWYKYYQLGGKGPLTNCKTNPPWSYMVGYSPTGTDASNTVTSTFDLKAGSHTFQFSARSYNIHIDRIHFCHDAGTGNHLTSTGACYESTLPVSILEGATQLESKLESTKNKINIQKSFSGSSIEVNLNESYEIVIHDLRGKIITQLSGNSPKTFSLPASISLSGLYWANIKTSSRSTSYRMSPAI